MIQFILGFVSGVYIATKYDVKPYVEKAEQFISENIPKKKEE